MRSVGILLVLIILTSCNSNGPVTIDNVGKKFDSSAQQLYDSTKKKAIELKNNIKKKLDEKDSSSVIH